MLAIYLWIRFDKLYKLVESFILNLYFVLNYLPKTEKYSNEFLDENIAQISLCYISMDLSRLAVQTDGNLFFKFWSHFLN